MHFLHENPKRRKSWVNTGQKASTMIAKLNVHAEDAVVYLVRCKGRNLLKLLL